MLGIKKCCTIVMLFFVIQSCGPGVLIDEEHSLPEEIWTYDNPVNFGLTITDTLQIYKLLLKVQYSDLYPYQNIYTRIHTTFPTGKKITETLSLDLSSKSGHPYGNCSGEACTIEIPIQEEAFFSIEGEYLFEIEQFMRVDSLRGINKIGFKIEETDKRRSLNH